MKGSAGDEVPGSKDEKGCSGLPGKIAETVPGRTGDAAKFLERIEEKIEDEQAEGDAAEAFSNLDLGPEKSDYTIDLNEPPPPEPDYDTRLAELKRRMGED